MQLAAKKDCQFHVRKLAGETSHPKAANLQ